VEWTRQAIDESLYRRWRERATVMETAGAAVEKLSPCLIAGTREVQVVGEAVVLRSRDRQRVDGDQVHEAGRGLLINTTFVICFCLEDLAEAQTDQSKFQSFPAALNNHGEASRLRPAPLTDHKGRVSERDLQADDPPGARK